jgi:hypothetical protein
MTVPVVRDPTKTYIDSPLIKIAIIEDGLGILDTIIEDFDMEVEITKDTDEEPNSATVTIYGLATSTRTAITEAAAKYAPIEIYMTPAGSVYLPTGLPNYVLAFKGELDAVHTNQLRPGHETIIQCTGQRIVYVSGYMDQKTYPLGTPKAVIIAELANATGLPLQMGTLPGDAILLSQSFSGPIFPLLRQFCADNGLYAWIEDGTLKIASFYMPLILVPKVILAGAMIESPLETSRTDSVDVLQRTIVETALTVPLSVLRPKRTKSAKKQLFTTYIASTVVDTEIPGVLFRLLANPDIQCDDLVTVVDPLDPLWLGKLFRVKSVMHYGDNYGGEWTTELETDNYEAA